VLVAASDSQGDPNPEGLLVAGDRLKDAKTVCDYVDGRRLARRSSTSNAISDSAARPDVVREDNVHRLKTRLVRRARTS
jgi:glutamate dehydrogenase (NAD(P)+)